jgi:hypothetical protein
MVIRTSIFDFLRIEHLTWVGEFSPSVDSSATVDHYNVLKSCFCVGNLIVEFNVLSRTGLGTEIDQFYAEAQLLPRRKANKVATSWKSHNCKF